MQERNGNIMIQENVENIRMDNPLDVVFFSDRSMLPGLHVAITSLLRSAKQTCYRVHLFLNGTTFTDARALHETFGRGSNGSQLIIKDFIPPKTFTTLLHGNAMPYGRLQIADLLPESNVCVYLDSDLIVNLDLGDMFRAGFGSSLFAVGGVGPRKNALDKNTLQKAGLDMEGPYFNSGVIAFRLDRWRAAKASNRCEDVIKNFGNELISHDQTILNIAFHDSFISLGKRFNFSLTPRDPTLESPDSCIYHFVGSPKPWDRFGKRLHPNYMLWRKLYEDTAIAQIPPHVFQSNKRLFSTVGSVYRAFIRKLRGSV